MHSIRMGGETISCKATAGTILLKDTGGKPDAGHMMYLHEQDLPSIRAT